jgi:hypothetical protein
MVYAFKMSDKLKWIETGDGIHYRCPLCDAVETISRVSGKESQAEWQKRLDGRLLEHLDEHKRRDQAKPDCLGF